MAKPAVNRIGETNIATCGMKMTIIAYRNNKDIDVQFEDNIIVTHKTYCAFKEGLISYPFRTKQNCCNKSINRIGETNIAKCGIKMTIIAYRNNKDLDIQFEDNIIVTHKTYRAFKEGLIGHSFRTKRAINRIGQSATMRCGLRATITDYKSQRDITVKFEDNSVVTKQNYETFYRSVTSHPTLKVRHKNSTITVNGLLFNIHISDIAYTTNDTTNYFCECPVCGHKDIWNVAEIKEHSETCHTESR